jgi:transposase
VTSIRRKSTAAAVPTTLRGLSNSEIAGELIIGENTIKTYVSHIFGKRSPATGFRR